MKVTKTVRRVLKDLAVVYRLRKCRHQSTSSPGSYGTLMTCFYCGSTRRVGEDGWAAPWMWRG